MKSIFAALAVLTVPLALFSLSPSIDEGKQIFISRCAKCHDDNARKTLPDGTNLLARLAASKDLETALGTRLKDPAERKSVKLYIDDLIAHADQLKAGEGKK